MTTTTPNNTPTRRGRPPGSKNKKTLEREAIIEYGRDLMYASLADILHATIEDAKNGDASARKLIIERLIPAMKMDDGDGEKKAAQVIVNVLPASAPQDHNVAIDVTPTVKEIEHHDNDD